MRIGPQNRYLNALRKNYAQALEREAALLDFVASLGDLLGCGDDASRADVHEAVRALVYLTREKR